MIGYVTVGTNDLARTARFYDALLAEIGARRSLENERFIAWATAPNRPSLCVTLPYDGEPATPGNGSMVALLVDDRDTVDRLHAIALALGGRSEGKPGDRENGFYASYFRDPDGNKLNAFCIVC